MGNLTLSDQLRESTQVMKEAIEALRRQSVTVSQITARLRELERENLDLQDEISELNLELAGYDHKAMP